MLIGSGFDFKFAEEVIRGCLGEDHMGKRKANRAMDLDATRAFLAEWGKYDWTVELDGGEIG